MMHFHDVERMLAEAGYRYSHTGKHHVYRHSDGTIMVIAAHGHRTFAASEVRRIQRDLRNRANPLRKSQKVSADGED